MFVHCNANIVDFREKESSLFFFYALLISSAVQDRLWGLLAPWPLGVFRYRLLRLYLSTDCTSMLNLPFIRTCTGTCSGTCSGTCPVLTLYLSCHQLINDVLDTSAVNLLAEVDSVTISCHGFEKLLGTRNLGILIRRDMRLLIISLRL